MHSLGQQVTLALLFGVLAAVPWASHATPNPSTTQVVQRQPITDEKPVAGTIAGTESTEARARTGGTVTKVMVERGSRVEKGQILAVLEDNRLPGQVSGTSHAKEAAEAQVKLAKNNLARTRSLLPVNAASPRQLEEAQAQYEAALAQLAAADNRILAPQTGLVAELHAVSGSMLMPGESFATVAIEPLLVKMEVPERHAHQVRVGDEIFLAPTLQTVSPSGLSGQVSRIYPGITNGRLTVEATAEGLGAFKIGEKVLVRLKTGEHMGILVPASALIPRNGLVFVKLASGAEIIVQPGQMRDDGTVEILSGLNDGDTVVLP